MTRCWKWDVTVLTSPQLRRLVKYAVIVLNRPVSQSPEFITDFWNNAAATITVDGGTLRWEKFLDSLPEGSRETLKRQNFITGDFDSIPHDALEKFKKAGYKIIPTPDQDHTDFTKSLMELTKHCQQNSILMEHVVVLAQTSGRVDHVLGNIQTLFLAKDKHLLDPHTKLYILSDDSLSWLLLPGEHIITVPEEVRDQKRAWCSLVPIGQECESVTTAGLKWNLEDQTLKFGEIVSTSNTFSGDHEVKIRCSHPILWSMTIPIVGSE